MQGESAVYCTEQLLLRNQIMFGYAFDLESNPFFWRWEVNALSCLYVYISSSVKMIVQLGLVRRAVVAEKVIGITGQCNIEGHCILLLIYGPAGIVV
ncbi:hypothetical protein BVRB_3g049050 [Beta vulgaris subsp. vulgaris]|nr:hypothetical protein BVRB_3g049050 [Beta vulgaris subsp. vulgaris]